MSNNPEKTLLNWLRLPGVKPYIFAVISTLLVFWEAYANPFGLDASTDRVSASAISTAIAPFYGGNQYRGRDNILIVLYDQAYFDAQGGQDSGVSQFANTQNTNKQYTNKKITNTQKQVWPIEPKKHLRLIQRLAEANPAAIFLDVYFTSQNKQREQALSLFYQNLQDIDCNDKEIMAGNCAEDGEAPVFLASLLTDLSPNAAGVEPPRVALAEVSEQSHLYKLQEQVPEACPALHDTAAYALYKKWCDRQKIFASPTSTQNDSCQTMSHGLDQKMYLQWGYAPSPEFAAFSTKHNKNAVVCQQQPNGIAKIFVAIKLSFNNFLRDEDKPANFCPYHNSVSALYAQSVNFTELKTLVENKVVLIGAKDYHAADVIESHVHGFLPGVFWHAAALDNLIERDQYFFREAPFILGVLFETLIALTVFFIMARLIHLNALTDMGISKKGKYQTKNRNTMTCINIATGFIAALLLSALLCIVWMTQNYAPSNWVGSAVLLIALCATPTIAVFYFSSRLSTWLLDFTACLTASLQKLISRLTNGRAPEINKHCVAYRPLRLMIKTLRVVIFFIITIMLAVLVLGIGLMLFFAPIVYFSIDVRPIWHYGIFALAYGFLIMCLFNYWAINSSKLNKYKIHSGGQRVS